MPDTTLTLPVPHHIHAPSGTQGLLQVLRAVDPMNRQKIQAIRAEPGTADLQLALEGSGILLRWNLALEDALFVGTVRQCPSQLPLGRSVMASRLDMVKAKGDRPFKRALEVGL